jgi:hypothetical protein
MFTLPNQSVTPTATTQGRVEPRTDMLAIATAFVERVRIVLLVKVLSIPIKWPAVCCKNWGGF